MNRRRALTLMGIGTVAAATLGVSGCGMMDKRYRYKMTVEIETPQGLRTGSSVREIIYSNPIIKLPDAGGSARQRGEAVAVDLPNGQTLFALLANDGFYTLQAAFGDDKSATLDAAFRDKRVVELHPRSPPMRNWDPQWSGYPLLVRFIDNHDPKSVEAVDKDNLAVSFGAGYRLRRITVQMTN